MPKIILAVKEEQKALWVEAAYAERVTLSEWIRRRCDAGLRNGERPVMGQVSEEQLDGIRVVPLEGELAAGDPGRPGAGERGETGSPPSPAPAASSLPEHKADPKDKAEQEHARGAKKTVRARTCEHRVPVGSYCKRCD